MACPAITFKRRPATFSSAYKPSQTAGPSSGSRGGSRSDGIRTSSQVHRPAVPRRSPARTSFPSLHVDRGQVSAHPCSEWYGRDLERSPGRPLRTIAIGEGRDRQSWRGRVWIHLRLDLEARAVRSLALRQADLEERPASREEAGPSTAASCRSRSGCWRRSRRYTATILATRRSELNARSGLRHAASARLRSGGARRVHRGCAVLSATALIAPAMRSEEPRRKVTPRSRAALRCRDRWRGPARALDACLETSSLKPPPAASGTGAGPACGKGGAEANAGAPLRCGQARRLTLRHVFFRVGSAIRRSSAATRVVGAVRRGGAGAAVSRAPSHHQHRDRREDVGARLRRHEAAKAEERREHAEEHADPRPCTDHDLPRRNGSTPTGGELESSRPRTTGRVRRDGPVAPSAATYPRRGPLMKRSVAPTSFRTSTSVRRRWSAGEWWADDGERRARTTSARSAAAATPRHLDMSRPRRFRPDLMGLDVLDRRGWRSWRRRRWSSSSVTSFFTLDLDRRGKASTGRAMTRPSAPLPFVPNSGVPATRSVANRRDDRNGAERDLALLDVLRRRVVLQSKSGTARVGPSAPRSRAGSWQARGAPRQAERDGGENYAERVQPPLAEHSAPSARRVVPMDPSRHLRAFPV